MSSREERSIPQRLIGAAAETLAVAYTNSQLDTLLDNADAPAATSSSNKTDKVRSRLLSANGLSDDPLSVLGEAIEDIMEPECELNPEVLKCRDRIYKQLARAGLSYERQGVIVVQDPAGTPDAAVVVPNEAPTSHPGIINQAKTSVQPSPYPPAPKRATPTMETNIKVFISHSSHDEGLVELVANLVKEALHLKTNQIGCTSIPRFALSAGDKTSEKILKEIGQSAVFIAILTQGSTDSFYVIAELGARWMTGRRIVPLLSPGSEFSDSLKGPFADLNGIRTSDRAGLSRTLTEMADAIGSEIQPSYAYEDQLASLVGWSSAVEKPTAAIRTVALTSSQGQDMRLSSSSPNDSATPGRSEGIRPKGKPSRSESSSKNLEGAQCPFCGHMTYGAGAYENVCTTCGKTGDMV